MADNRSAARVFSLLGGIGWVWDHSLGWILTQLLVWPIKGYQRVISPMTPPSCRLHPSCSSYAVQSIEVHGPLKGFVLASWRLLRCNPWNRGGVDPVPARGRWLPDVLPNGEPRWPSPPDSGGAPHAARPRHGTMGHLHPDDGIERRAS